MINKSKSLSNGIQVIKDELLTIPSKPGVYQMIGANEENLYIGKAKNLKNRIVFYTQPKRLNSRLTYMVSNTMKMEIIITASEMEALLLESNLIKKYDNKNTNNGNKHAHNSLYYMAKKPCRGVYG